MTMTPVSPGHFWLYTIGLLLVWAIVLSSASPSTPAASAVGANALVIKGSEKEREVRHARNCKALCSDCGCLGFYCGEECICECNNDKADTECITTMQQRAQSMRAPFELLIQGPSTNRFVRNAARSFDQDTERRRSYSMERNKRSTVLVYKPSAEATRLNAMAGERVKRSSSPNLEWFSDFASTLVRPAPLGGHAEARQRSLDDMPPATQFKRSADERPWFAENTNLLIRPSPLFKRQSYAARQKDASVTNSKESSNDVDDSPASTFDAVKAIPKAIQQTLQNIQESAFSEDFNEALRSKLKEGSEALQNTFGAQNFDFRDARQRQRKDFEDALRGMNLFRPAFEQSAPAAAAEVSTTAAPSASGSGLHVFPWLKAGLFLRRVKQAIN